MNPQNITTQSHEYINRPGYTQVSKDYIKRPGYSHAVLNNLAAYVDVTTHSPIRDIEAGRGRLTQDLLALGFKDIIAIEPSDTMRNEGSLLTEEQGVAWKKGSNEDTDLASNSADWLFMASSFHWVKPEIALPEFKRVLAPGGFFTALWNPRDLEQNPLEQKIQNLIFQNVPAAEQHAFEEKKALEKVEQILVQTGDFEDVIRVESCHTISMEQERYLNEWKFVHDLQTHTSTEMMTRLLEEIRSMLEGEASFSATYRTYSWTARRTD